VKTAVIVLGHGSRQHGADVPLERLAAALRSEGRYAAVEPAFLQYMQPTLSDAVSRCAAQGAERIVVVPFFVQPGAHVTRDIPEGIAEEQRKFPSVRFSVTGHVGGHPMMVKIVEDLIKQQM
jgi:sirohydrochlorin ferrochelatase